MVTLNSFPKFGARYEFFLSKGKFNPEMKQALLNAVQKVEPNAQVALPNEAGNQDLEDPGTITRLRATQMAKKTQEFAILTPKVTTQLGDPVYGAYTNFDQQAIDQVYEVGLDARGPFTREDVTAVKAIETLRKTPDFKNLFTTVSLYRATELTEEVTAGGKDHILTTTSVEDKPFAQFSSDQFLKAAAQNTLQILPPEEDALV